MADAALLDLGVAELARAIRRGEATATEATEAALARAAAAQPVTNAYVEIMADRARQDAAELDAEQRAGRLRGPLHGVPLAHKDCLERAGVAMSVGSRVMADAPLGREDATVLRRLREAGAVDLGRLHLNEFVAGPTGQNPYLGDCRNPWDPKRISGGSSSGSGAAVAAGACFAALGSDTGGSIRLPSAMNGLFGLKPTQGRVSQAGCFPRAHSLDCIGPMARSAEDCALILSAIAGPDPRDPTAFAAAVPDYVARLATGAVGSRLAVLETPVELHPDVAVLFARAAREAAQLFTQPAPRLFKNFTACDAAGDVISKVEASTLHARWMASHGEEYSTAVHARTEPGLAIPAQRYLEALTIRAKLLQAFLDEEMAGADALLCPAVPIPTPTRAEADMEKGGKVFAVVAQLTRLTRPFSYLGLPVLTVPIGLDGDGMPVGAQLIGRPFGEARLLAMGAYLADALGWSLRPGLPPSRR